jgi:hypothetical protein
MRRLFAAISPALALCFATTLAAQVPASGETIRFRPVGGSPSDESIPWTQGTWEGVDDRGFQYRGASDDVYSLPLSGWAVQRKVGDQSLLFAAVGTAIGAGLGAMVASSMYREEWSRAIPAHCGFFGCVEAVPARLLNPGGPRTRQAALAGGAAGLLLGRLVGAWTPRWASVQIDPQGVQVEIPTR